MKKTLLATLIAASLAGFNMVYAATEEAPAAKPDELPLKAETTSPEALAVAQLALAAQLAAYGLQANDPVALIAAARITQAVPTQDKPLEKKPAEGDEPAAPAEKQTGVDLQSVEFLLNKARELSGGDQTILALAKAVPESAPKGAIPGPGVHHGVVRARTTDTYHNQWTFRGREIAMMSVSGDGDTDLDCFVYDGNGNLITYDNDGTDQCVLMWTPRFTGPFTLRIENLGGVYNRYRIAWN